MSRRPNNTFLKKEKWEGGLGWGTHVNPWLFHFNVWQNPPQIKKNKIKKKKRKIGG